MTTARPVRKRRTARRAAAIAVTAATVTALTATLTAFTDTDTDTDTVRTAASGPDRDKPRNTAAGAERHDTAVRPAPGSGRLTKAVDLPASARPHGGPGKVIEYTSTGADGSLVTVSGMMFAPAGKPPKGGWPTISLSHGTVGNADQCAPSRTEASTFVHDPEIRRWLDRGVAIVATDYEGLGTPGPHPYLHARSAAYGSIDIVHAARQTKVGLSRTWAVMGHSQGGHAAVNTAVYATRYAPGLDFRGALATAPPTKMSSLVRDRSDSPSEERIGRTSLYPLVVDGLLAIDPDLDFTHLYSDRARQLIPTARNECSDAIVAQIVQLGLNDRTFWKQRPETVPALMNAMREHVDTPVVKLDRPVMIVQGAKDEIVQAPVTSAYAQDLKKAGSKVIYREYPTADHFTVLEQSDAETTPWLERQLGLK
ncbi:alpha/beta hydrolase family protein [Streptomyces tsukubensis]|uniref:alpha/beta hydrolase family protein n=1 Tax=Streptomyces tsukubensis TaxID=83656 RepID=UPI003685F505